MSIDSAIIDADRVPAGAHLRLDGGDARWPAGTSSQRPCPDGAAPASDREPSSRLAAAEPELTATGEGPELTSTGEGPELTVAREGPELTATRERPELTATGEGPKPIGTPHQRAPTDRDAREAADWTTAPGSDAGLRSHEPARPDGPSRGQPSPA